jgi:hypothetical protein
MVNHFFLSTIRRSILYSLRTWILSETVPAFFVSVTIVTATPMVCWLQIQQLVEGTEINCGGRLSSVKTVGHSGSFAPIVETIENT